MKRTLIVVLGILSSHLAMYGQGCVTAPSGLVGWWPGDLNANDISGNSNNGTASSITYDFSEVAYGFDFDGTSSTVIASSSSSLTVTNLTFDAWVFPIDNSLRPVIEYGNNSETAGPHLWIGASAFGSSPGSLFANIRDTSGGDHLIEVANAVPTNQWSFIAVTYNASTGTGALYLNGATTPVATASWGTFVPKTAKQLNIGYRPSTSLSGAAGKHFDGIIDEVEIFNRALSGSELAGIYNAGPSGKCKPCYTAPSGMVGWWAGDNNANDISGHSNNGSATSISYTTGEVAQGFIFNGTSSSVIANSSASLTLTNLTFDAWIYPTNIDARPVVEYANNSETAGPHLWIGASEFGSSPGSLYANIRDTSEGEHIIEVAGVIPVNEWSFIAVTYTTSTGYAQLYLNGRAIGSAVYFGTIVPKTGKKVNIGYRPSSSLSGAAGTHFGGIIDEVEIFNVALTESQMEGIYIAGPSGKCK